MGWGSTDWGAYPWGYTPAVAGAIDNPSYEIPGASAGLAADWTLVLPDTATMFFEITGSSLAYEDFEQGWDNNENAIDEFAASNLEAATFHGSTSEVEDFDYEWKCPNVEGKVVFSGTTTPYHDDINVGQLYRDKYTNGRARCLKKEGNDTVYFTEMDFHNSDRNPAYDGFGSVVSKKLYELHYGREHITDPNRLDKHFLWTLRPMVPIHEGTFSLLVTIDKDFTAPVSGKYLLNVNIVAWSIWSAERLVFWEARINEGGASPITKGGANEWQMHANTATVYQVSPTFSTIVDLEAGVNNVRIYADQNTTGGSYLSYDATKTPTQVSLQFISGSGAGGTVVDDKENSADQGSLAASTWNVITSLSHTINVQEQENFQVNYRILFKSTTNTTVGIAYRINSGSWIPLDAETATGNWWKGFTGAVVLTLSAGQKIIEFAEQHDSGTGTVYGATSFFGLTWNSKSTVMQLRGGLVPIQENSVDKLAKPQALNFTGGATVTENDGVADIEIPGWRTVLDLDFTAEGNQTLSTDTTYSIGGKTWTKINSVNDAVAMAVVNGTGLVIQPGSTSDHHISNRILPAITCPLTSLIPNIDMNTQFRVTVYISAGNWAANYDFTEICLENPTTNTWLAVRKIYSAGALNLNPLHLYNNASIGDIKNSNIASSDVLQMELNSLASLDTIWSHGSYSAGWPAQASLIPQVVREATGATMHNLYSGATAVLGAISAWNLLLGAARAGSGTSLSTTIARIKIEVKY